MKKLNMSFVQLYMLIILILLTLTSTWSYLAVENIEDESDKIVKSAIPTYTASNELLTELLNQETGMRGYILTGEAKYLDPYVQGTLRSKAIIKQLQTAETQHPYLRDILNNEALPTLDALETYFENQILLVQDGKIEEAASRINDGKNAMDHFRDVHNKIQQVTNKIITSASDRTHEAASRLRFVLILGGIVVALFTLLFLYSFRLQKHQDKLKELSITDGLSNLNNRRAFDKRLTDCWEDGNEEGLPLSLIMLDIDNFKLYNDTYGHLAGDVCIQQIAHILKEEATLPMFPARYGGEEFAVILPHSNEWEARKVAERIRSEIESLQIEHRLNTAGIVTASLGVATVYPTEEMTGDELIKMADEALYESKRKGKNQVNLYKAS